MLRLSDAVIQITILGDTHKYIEECEASCGINWSLPESISLARNQTKERFDDKVNIEYRDLSAMNDIDISRWREQIKEKNLLLPLLLMNGQLRISGPFDFRQLFDTVEAELEVQRVTD
jgi:hypothetical protein